MVDDQLIVGSPSPVGLFWHLSCLCNFFRSCLLVFRQAQAPQHRPAAGDVRRQEQGLPRHGIVSLWYFQLGLVWFSNFDRLIFCGDSSGSTFPSFDPSTTFSFCPWLATSIAFGLLKVPKEDNPNQLFSVASTVVPSVRRDGHQFPPSFQWPTSASSSFSPLVSQATHLDSSPRPRAQQSTKTANASPGDEQRRQRKREHNNGPSLTIRLPVELLKKSFFFPAPRRSREATLLAISRWRNIKKE